MLQAFRKVAKEMTFRTLGSEVLQRAKVAAITRSNALTILNLHRVAPDDGSAYRPLEPALFDNLLSSLKSRFDLVTFGTIDRHGTGRPKLILSFDDGYEDFATHAAPILAKHGVRANQNIIPACVESGRPPLNVLLQDFVGRARRSELEKIKIPGFSMTKSGKDRVGIGNHLSAFIKQKPMTEQDELANIILPQLERLSFEPTRMMSLEQLRQLATAHEFGAHSFAHASLAYESDDYLREDVRRCRTWLKEKLDLQLKIYALPNGSYRNSQIGILKSAEIEHILLVNEDFSSVREGVHPRFTFDARSKSEMLFKSTGGLRWPPRSMFVQ